MAGRVMLTRSLLGAVVCLLLLFLAWYAGRSGPGPKGAVELRPLALPPPVTLPPDLPARLARRAGKEPFDRVLVRRGGSDPAAAGPPWDLLVFPGPGGECRLRWPPAPTASGEGVPRTFVLAWAGSPSPRTRALVVRCLEVVLRCLGLERSRVWTLAEVQAGRQAEAPGAAPVGKEAFRGAVLRSWIRGLGAGQEEHRR